MSSDPSRKPSLLTRLAGIFVGFAIAAAALVAFGGWYLWKGTGWLARRPTAGSLQLGERVRLAGGTVGPEGGAIRVNQPGDALDGMTIEVPAGAYSREVQFEISSRAIEGHTFGSDVSPKTPLIQIEAGDQLAEELLTISIPIRIEQDEFAMAFAYEPQTFEFQGVLEGVALLKSTNESVLVTTRQPSRDVFVSSIPTERLRADVQTGFQHGVDDWPFVNYGSYISPSGHCAGQSLSAMYYFIEDLGAPLYEQYDNYDNSYRDTPDLFWDDELGYRLASVTQEAIDWGSQGRKFWFKYAANKNDQMVYNAFTYAMMVTNAPQYVGIYGEDDEGNRLGHAMVIYGKDGDSFGISDPNYPLGVEGGERRAITFNPSAGKFDPYYSGPNADDLGHAYTSIVYFGYRDLIDWDQLGQLWQELKAGHVGELEFPDFELGVTEADSQVEELLWFNHISAQEQIAVRVRDVAFNPYLVVYDGDTNLIAKGDEALEINLREGDNYLGFMVFSLGPDNAMDWVGFDWIKVIYDREEATREAEPVAESVDTKQDYGVFLADGEVLVGSQSDLEQTPTCNLTGWGINCEETVGERTTLNMVLGPFSSREAAAEAYCENLDKDSVHYPPLVVGTKGTFMGQDLWISNTPGCP
ncbi:MAG: hypothetical protein ACE5M4_00240 [Anaerolineales bacterium]